MTNHAIKKEFMIPFNKFMEQIQEINQNPFDNKENFQENFLSEID